MRKADKIWKYFFGISIKTAVTEAAIPKYNSNWFYCGSKKKKSKKFCPEAE
jgi:hypothetical protein